MRGRRLLAAFALALLAAPGTWWRGPPFAKTDDSIAYHPLPATTPSDWPDGLDLERAWHLQPGDPQFAGVSALLREGAGFRAFSDLGITALLPRPPAAPGERLPAPVRPLPRSRDIANTPDVEAAARDPASGTIWLAYEHHNAIRRIDTAGRSTLVRPPALRKLGLNSGIEAMARLSDGRFLMLAERSERGFLFAGDPVEGPVGGPTVIRFTAPMPGNFRPTDMALLPDGRVLVLLRAIEWHLPPFASMLAIGDPATIRAGQDWRLEPLATLAVEGLRENYEGLAVEPAPNQPAGSDAAGGTVLTIWLISDDNRSALQRTLLLKLRWEPDKQTAREAEPREPQKLP